MINVKATFSYRSGHEKVTFTKLLNAVPAEHEVVAYADAARLGEPGSAELLSVTSVVIDKCRAVKSAVGVVFDVDCTVRCVRRWSGVLEAHQEARRIDGLD